MPQALEPPAAPGPVGDPAHAAPAPAPEAPEIVRDGPRGRHPTLKRAIARFVAEVAEMPADRIEARWRAEVAERLDGRTPGTRKSYVVRYRSALENAFGPDHPALGVVSARGPSREITTARRQAATRPPSRDRPAAERPPPFAGPGERGGTKAAPEPRDPPRSVRVAPSDGSYTIPPDDAATSGETSASPEAPGTHAHRLGAEIPRKRPSRGRNLVPPEIPPPPGEAAAAPEGDGSLRPARAFARRDGEDTRPDSGRPRPVGRPGVVRDAAAAFAAKLRRASAPAEVERLWSAELAAYADRADRTVKRIIAEHYRPAVRAALGDDHPALAVVKPPAEVTDRIRADDLARVAASHRHQVAVPNWREIVGRATASLASGAPLDLVAGLLLATGRRPYEVCCTGHFAPASLPGGSPGARSRWSVLFSGQAKTKDRPGTRAGVAYEIPVLAEARAVIAALDKLRASPEGRAWAGLSNEAFRATTLRLALTEAVTRVYGELWPEGDRLEPRALRPLYAEIAHTRFGPPSATKNSFFAAVLGHTMNDLHTSLSYMDYHLPEPGGDEDGAGARRAADGVADRLSRRVQEAGSGRGRKA